MQQWWSNSPGYQEKAHLPQKAPKRLETVNNWGKGKSERHRYNLETEKVTKSDYETLNVCLQPPPDPAILCSSKARCFSPGKTFLRKITTVSVAPWQLQSYTAPNSLSPQFLPNKGQQHLLILNRSQQQHTTMCTELLNILLLSNS